MDVCICCFVSKSYHLCPLRQVIDRRAIMKGKIMEKNISTEIIDNVFKEFLVISEKQPAGSEKRFWKFRKAKDTSIQDHFPNVSKLESMKVLELEQRVDAWLNGSSSTPSSSSSSSSSSFALPSSPIPVASSKISSTRKAKKRTKGKERTKK